MENRVNCTMCDATIDPSLDGETVDDSSFCWDCWSVDNINLDDDLDL